MAYTSAVKTWTTEVLYDTDLNAEFTNCYNAMNGNNGNDIRCVKLALNTAPLIENGIVLDNGATDGGSIYFNGVNTSYLQSDVAGTTLTSAGFTTVTHGAATAFNIGSVDIMKAMVPVGSIVALYDFNGTATFDSSYWVYCDGSAISNASSILDGETTPDLSGRYMVGFGTDGGGDIDSAAWATAATGNASHQVNLSHTHTGPSHTHTGPSHTHTGTASGTTGAGSSHTHGVGSYQFKTAYYTHSSPRFLGFYQSGGTLENVLGSATTQSGTGATDMWAKVTPPSSNTTYYTKDGTGSSGAESAHTHSFSAGFTTSASGTGATGAGGTGATGSGGSATQSIQPRSIRVRYIMRVV